jgi:hypothetical protein
MFSLLNNSIEPAFLPIFDSEPVNLSGKYGIVDD